MDPEPHPDRSDTLILRARHRDTCALLDWTQEIEGMRKHLEKRDVERVECRFDELTLWGGSLSDLPESLEDTMCAKPLQALFGTLDPQESAQRLEALPEICRHGANVVEWYGTAARLASEGKCEKALVLSETIWRVSHSAHAHLLRRPEFSACLDAQSSQERSP